MYRHPYRFDWLHIPNHHNKFNNSHQQGSGHEAYDDDRHHHTVRFISYNDDNDRDTIIAEYHHDQFNHRNDSVGLRSMLRWCH